MNILGWKFGESEHEAMIPGKPVGYFFTIDGKLLEFDDFIPLSGSEIVEVDYLSDTQTLEDAPYLACCICGYVECDAVRASVKFYEDTVFWIAFKFFEEKPTILGAYCFDREQYCQTINSLLGVIKNTKANEGQ